MRFDSKDFKVGDCIKFDSDSIALIIEKSNKTATLVFGDGSKSVWYNGDYSTMTKKVDIKEFLKAEECPSK